MIKNATTAQTRYIAPVSQPWASTSPQSIINFSELFSELSSKEKTIYMSTNTFPTIPLILSPKIQRKWGFPSCTKCSFLSLKPFFRIRFWISSYTSIGLSMLFKTIFPTPLPAVLIVTEPVLKRSCSINQSLTYTCVILSIDISTLLSEKIPPMLVLDVSRRKGVVFLF